jgi:hypothetical protein
VGRLPTPSTSRFFAGLRSARLLPSPSYRRRRVEPDHLHSLETSEGSRRSIDIQLSHRCGWSGSGVILRVRHDGCWG